MYRTISKNTVHIFVEIIVLCQCDDIIGLLCLLCFAIFSCRTVIIIIGKMFVITDSLIGNLVWYNVFTHDGITRAPFFFLLWTETCHRGDAHFPRICFGKLYDTYFRSKANVAKNESAISFTCKQGCGWLCYIHFISAFIGVYFDRRNYKRLLYIGHIFIFANVSGSGCMFCRSVLHCK